jgi:branched-chain amino acid aminotransferase
MVNNNGTIQQEATFSLATNRGFLFGDSVFETVRTLNKKVLFLEDHYFRLMASMRICRMEIPMHFTMEYFESQILNLILHSNAPANRVRFSVFRIGDGFYMPTTNDVEFLVTFQPLENEVYFFNEANYEVELFKDAYVTKQLLSTLKTNNKMIQITGSIFAKENGYQNCLLLNDEKNVVEALQGNVFMKMGNQLLTPPISDGCLNGIMRKQVLALAQKVEGLQVIEKSISPFDLQKADELFITNVIQGIQPITKYRKKTYENGLAKELQVKLNAQVRLN